MSKKIKILMLIDDFLPSISGAIRAVDNYAKNLNGSFDVTVATLSDKQDIYNYLPYEVVFGNQHNLYKNLVKRQFDIIHLHSDDKIFNLALKLAKIKKVPLVASIHRDSIAKIIAKNNSIIAKVKIAKLIKKYNKLTEAFVYSPYVAEHLREYGFNGKVSYLPLASDINSDIKKSKLIEFANAQYKLDMEENVLISIGNLRTTKRLDFALKALSIAKKKGFKFRYFIVGRGEEEERLKNICKELCLTKNVEFLGYVPDDKLCALIARANLLLLPTTYDLFGLSKVECAGFGTPGLYIMDSFVSNEVFDDINGYLSKNSIEDYAKRILEIFADGKKLKEVSSNAYSDLYVAWEQSTEMLQSRLVGVLDEQIKLTKRLN